MTKKTSRKTIKFRDHQIDDLTDHFDGAPIEEIISLFQSYREQGFLRTRVDYDYDGDVIYFEGERSETDYEYKRRIEHEEKEKLKQMEKRKRERERSLRIEKREQRLYERLKKKYG